MIEGMAFIYEPLTPPGYLTPEEEGLVSALIVGREEHIQVCDCDYSDGAESCMSVDENGEDLFASVVSLNVTPEMSIVHVLRQFPDSNWLTFFGRIKTQLVDGDGQEITL